MYLKNVKKIILFSFLLISSFLYGQPVNQFFHSENIVVPSDSSYNLYFPYKIAYNNLVFVKSRNSYTSNFRVFLEVYDKNSNFIARQIKDDKIKVDDFGKTNDKNEFLSDLIQFKLSPGEYQLHPVINDLNSEQEIKLPVEIIKINSKENYGLFKPIVINTKQVSCNNDSGYTLANYGNSIPFTDNSYSLMIPTSDKTLKKVYAVVVNNTDTVYKNWVYQKFNSNLNLVICGKEINIYENNKTNKTTNFILDNISSNLLEGTMQITVSKSDTSKEKKTYGKNVIWFNKPFSLKDDEYAIKMLKYMENENVIDTLLDYKSADYQKVLFAYWKKYDPDPSTAYNPLMAEYYSRIDYAIKNFTSITGKNGANSDRGKIFIRYGMPQKIERSSTDNGKVVETWVYEKSNKKFIFVDKDGRGEFKLVNG